MEQSEPESSNFRLEKAVDNMLRVGVIVLLIGLCLYFLMPFGLVLIWGAIIAVAIFPYYKRVLKLFRGRKILSSVVITLILLSLIIVPGWILTSSLLTGVEHLMDLYRQGMPIIPPPGETAKQWPAFTKPAIILWQNASEDLQGAAIKYKEQLKGLATWLLLVIRGFGIVLIQFLVSIFIAAVFLVLSDSLIQSSLRIFNKVAPNKGDNVAELTVSTIRSVVEGILGVAAIQAAMAGIAFAIAGVPYWALWTIVCLMLSVVQIGSWPVLIAATLYVFSSCTPLAAVLFTVWMVIVVITDNFLTPIFLGRGSSVPMIVVFMGAIGGFIGIGFLGLFLGAVILSIGYKLFDAWLNDRAQLHFDD